MDAAGDLALATALNQVVHVGPIGDDAAAGTEAQPFATLERARQAVRGLLTGRTSGPIIVLLGGGIHHSKATFTLVAEDSGTPERLVWYMANPGTRPVVSAGVLLPDWQPINLLPIGVPATARGQLWSTHWSLDCATVLADTEGMLDRAATADRWSRAGGEADERTLSIDPADLRPWYDPMGIDIGIVPTYPWISNTLPVATIDAAAACLKTAVPGTAPLSGKYRLENVPDGLDRPGTWWWDRRECRLVLWPRRPGRPEGMTAGVRTAALRLRGGQQQPVHHVGFFGLTFSHGARAVHQADDQIMIPRHDWDFHDVDNALVRLSGTMDVRFVDCTFTASGGTGLRVDQAARRATILHCRFTDLGGIGISLVGSLPGGGDVHGDHELAANHLHRIGRIQRSAPGILVYQSGRCAIRDNLLHDLPYAGIVLFGDRECYLSGGGKNPAMKLYGGECLIEHNEVSAIMQQLGDGTAIYLSATPGGSVIRRNHIHDITCQVNGGIRTDDQQSGVIVAENLIHDLNGFGIILKHVNHCRHNVVVNCRRHISARHWAPNVGSTILGNILAQYAPIDPAARVHEAALSDEPYGPFLTQQGPVRLNDYALADNLLYAPHEPAWAERAAAALEAIDTQASAVADPGFADAAARDYQLRPDGAARRAGFPHIEHWGPRIVPGPRMDSNHASLAYSAIIQRR